MALTEMSRRTFTKLAALASAAATTGVTVESTLVETEKAYAEEDVVYQKTQCRSCPRACGVIATIKNGRVIAVDGDPDDIFSAGGMCAKGQSAIQALYHPNRTKYPMRRVGERGVDNTWERISWDEAIDMMAGAMAEMRDKYGRNGLLMTTGGGGNPRIIDSIAFRDYWGAGNVFEPGAAQCAMPRTFVQKQMDGWLGFTSIGDQQCIGCFNPNWQSQLDVFVQMGGGGAASSSTITARYWNLLRDAGCKFINVDPRFTHDSARADLWLPIRGGTDVALMMCIINYLFETETYDEKFLLEWSNLPFLVDVTDEGCKPELGALLRASKVKGLDMSAGEGYVYYDVKTQKVTKAFAMGPDNEDQYNPQLFGTVEVEYADGVVRTCKTAGQLLKESVADATIEWAAKTCWVDESLVRTCCEWIAESKEFGGVGNGVSHDQNIQSAEAAMCTTLINQLKGRTQKKGANASSPRPNNKYKTGREKGRFTYSMSYDGRGYFNPNVDDDGNPRGPYIELPAVIERLGYIEHKGLGDWKHSQIPAVHEAILTGEPYQPRVWYERSGNKMATLADSSSWIPAFKKMDFTMHVYMYPTSFTFEAADLILPATEWLEMDYSPGGHGDWNGFIVSCALTYEHVDDRLIYGTLFKQLADKYNDKYAYNAYYVDQEYYTIRERDDYLADIAIKGMTWEETKQVNGWRNTTEQEFWDLWDGMLDQHLKVGEDGLYLGMGYKGLDYTTWAEDIKDNPRKNQMYCDRIMQIGRTGDDPAGELPPCTVDYSPVPFYVEPADFQEEEIREKYPLICSNGRLPYFHHTTLRNIPYLRETYPVPELWIHPEAASERGISDGDWVNIKSQRCEENEIIKDGIYAKAFVTEGINPGCVYMERFWNPEFLEEGQDARKSWTMTNYNVLSRRKGPHNPVMGTYTLRSINVEVAKAKRPEGIWYEPTDFQPWMPVPVDSTEGGYKA
ncbi:molybdopterin-dependent oxidoreductase [Denitrobacterium detoxificans]|uniref:molybdopterin-containing oxidoreductase family protein n=1 Tax=Denitrobacterium detoxificans TaxID=79604 RepID=UPI0026F137B6|nr:molybdopterin-dependent oxidoreductase [Denitrobacterium detoxificans]MBE6466488.1 hypothetical protein [Denitrobacterium detoxificans]